MSRAPVQTPSIPAFKCPQCGAPAERADLNSKVIGEENKVISYKLVCVRGHKWKTKRV